MEIIIKRRKDILKTIKVTQEVHDMLSEIGSKKDTYNDIIFKLIKEHNEPYSEEFEDDQADYYNRCIEKIENEENNEGDDNNFSEEEIQKYRKIN